MKSLRVICFFLLVVFAVTVLVQPLEAQRAAQGGELPFKVFLPLLTSSSCENIDGETYNALTVNPPPTDRPAEQHADLNLALRGYVATTSTLGLVDYAGPTDNKAPKLFSLFVDNRVPTFNSVSQVYNWVWATNSRGTPILFPPVTLAGMVVTPNEVLRVPHSEYNIGTKQVRPEKGFFIDKQEDSGTNYEVLVLYASEQRITLKYTREDNVVNGYTLHVENVCVAPALLDAYRTMNTAGRAQLPALKQGQGFGRAMNTEIGIVIRDSGAFMDPRSEKDWW